MSQAKEELPCPGPSIEAFEKLDVEPQEFGHEAHVYVAWCYLQRFDLLTSIDRFRRALLALTAKLGVPDKYHETITWFYLIAVAERAEGAAATDWAEFKRSNADLFVGSPSIIQGHYTKERLFSERARRIFILPDLANLR